MDQRDYKKTHTDEEILSSSSHLLRDEKPGLRSKNVLQAKSDAFSTHSLEGSNMICAARITITGRDGTPKRRDVAELGTRCKP